MEHLAKTHLRFIGLRKPDIRVQIDETIMATKGLGVMSRSHPELAEKAREADHDISEPGVAIKWTEDGSVGHFFNYLPTRMLTGLPVDVHGDFQVKADRESMSLDESNKVGVYNRALLRKAAELLVDQLINGDLKPGLWQRAARPQSGPTEWSDEIRQSLLPGNSWDKWVILAQRFHTNIQPKDEIAGFWRETARWMDVTVRGSRQCDRWKRTARNLCDRLATMQIPLLLIPVQSSTGETAVALPSRQKTSEPAERRIFFYKEETIPEMPDALIAAGRAVTNFVLGDWEWPAGVARFSMDEVLDDLRQVPLDVAAFESQPTLSTKEQENLLWFASRLLPENTPPLGFAWRAFTDHQNRQKMGRSISTLFLRRQ